MDRSPIVNIGKGLLSEGIVKEIIELLKNRTIIKVGIQKNALEMAKKERIIAKVIQLTECYLLDVRGNTFVIARKPLKGFKVPLKCKKITDFSKTADLSELDSDEEEEEDEDEDEEDESKEIKARIEDNEGFEEEDDDTNSDDDTDESDDDSGDE